MERPAGMDIHCLAGCSNGICKYNVAARQRRGWGSMVYHWRHPCLEHLAEKILERETAPRGSGRLHRLVLERAIDLAKSAPEHSIRDRRTSCMFDRYLFRIEIT